MYKLRQTHGMVKALLKAGPDFCATQLPYDVVSKIMENGEQVESDQEGYPIHVGDWYFDGTEVKLNTKKKVNK